MKRFTIFSDTHILAPHDAGYSVEDMIFEDSFMDDTVILTGDIIDRENARKRDVQLGNGFIYKLKSQFGGRYILGNHEGMKPGSYTWIDDETRTLFMHGHTIFWDKAKVIKWENKKLGMSKWKYRLYRLKGIFRRNKPKTLQLKDKYKDKIHDLLILYECKTIVFGHSHRNYDFQFPWGRVINVPQGRTEIELERK